MKNCALISIRPALQQRPPNDLEPAGRYEARELAGKFEALAQSLDVRDANFHRAQIDLLLRAARGLRGLDRAGAD